MLSPHHQRLRAQLSMPVYRATAWLLAPIGVVRDDVAAELRDCLLRRLEAVLANAALSLAVAAIAVSQHPMPGLRWWLAFELAIMLVRVPVVIAMMRFEARRDRGGTLSPWIIDAFVWIGTVWSGLLGIGTLLCMLSGDPALAILASVLCMGTIGVLSVRNPGAPRVTTLQMCLIIVPASVGFAHSPIPAIGWAVFLVPFYLFGLITITRQLHADYAALTTARICSRHHALHCALTGLPNRVSFDEALKASSRRASDACQNVSVLYLDLDGFKAVNDGFGHPTGDRLLRLVADRLRSLADPETVTARLGGDEFAVLLPFGDAQRVEAAARALIESIGRPYLVEGAPPLTIGVSIGIASGAEAERLPVRADAALYAAKRAGRGTFRWHWAEDDIAAESLRGIARRMRGSYDSALRLLAAKG